MGTLIEYLGGRSIGRIYTKVGNAVLRDENGNLDRRWFDYLAREVSDLYKRLGIEFLHVSSGAITAGKSAFRNDVDMNSFDEEEQILWRQLFAGLGQHRLMGEYDKAFSRFGQQITQRLITSHDLNTEEGLENLLSAYRFERAHNTIPVYNNNDTVCREELGGYSENDKLLADLIYAFELFTPELYKPGAESIAVIMSVDGENRHGFGGPEAKWEAIQKINEADIPVYLVDGKYRPGYEHILVPIIEGETVGRPFLPR